MFINRWRNHAQETGSVQLCWLPLQSRARGVITIIQDPFTLFRFWSDTVSGIINAQTRFFQTGINKRKISEVDWPGMWLLRPLCVCLCVCQAVSDLSRGVSCHANCHSNCFHFSVSILPQIFMSTQSFDFMLVVFPKACLIIRVDILASCRVCLHGCDD